MKKQSEAVRRCGKMSADDQCLVTLLIRLSAFRPNFFHAQVAALG